MSLTVDGTSEARLSAEVTAGIEDNALSMLERSDARLSSAGKADVCSPSARSLVPVIAGAPVPSVGGRSAVKLSTRLVAGSTAVEVRSADVGLDKACVGRVVSSIGRLGCEPGSAVFVEATGTVAVLRKVEVERDVDVRVVGTMTVVGLPFSLVLLGRQKTLRTGILIVNTLATVMVWNRRILVLSRRYIVVSECYKEYNRECTPYRLNVCVAIASLRRQPRGGRR